MDELNGTELKAFEQQALELQELEKELKKMLKEQYNTLQAENNTL